MGIGISELLIAVPVAIVSLALPVAILVLLIMTYKKVSNIERKMGG